MHPECKREIVEAADFVGSTSAIIDYVVQTNAKDFIIGTVDGVFAKIKELAPNKKFTHYYGCASLSKYEKK